MNRTLKQTAAFAAFGKGVKGRLVVNAAKSADDPVEILLIGPVGASWWSEEGIRQKDVIDAIAAVPAGRKIVLGVNSTGGSVEDGLGIYAAIRRRAADITVRIDGYACSIASVFPLAASKVITPKASVWMIHNAWSGAIGNAQDMRQASAMLERHDAVLASVYAEHTGKTREECAAAMSEETWFTGEEAHAWGLATEMSDDEIELEPIESSPFACVPPSLVLAFGRPVARLEPLNAFRRGSTSAPAARHQSDARSNNDNSNHPMNRTAILALLKKHGVTLPDNATDTALNAEGLKLINAGKITLSEWSAASAMQAAPATQTGNAPTASTPTPSPTNVPSPAAGTDDPLAKRIASLEEQNVTLRRAEVTRRVDAAISERRVPNASRDFWIAQGMANASSLDQLANYPQQIPGETPLVEITNEAPTDILAGIERFRRPVEAVCRGERVRPQDITNGAMAIAKAVRAGGQRLLGAMNATTISADLKRAVLLQSAGMMAFRRRILPVRIWSTTFANVPLEGTDEITVPYLPLYTGASNTFAGTYVMDKNRQMDARKVTVNQRKYQPFNFSSAELARQPFFSLAQFVQQGAEQLAVDVFTQILGAITAANFPQVVKAELPDAFNTDDMIDLRAHANGLNWPQVGRSVVFDDPYETALLKDPSLKDAGQSGSTDPLRQGNIGPIAGFENIYANNQIPLNDGSLRGFLTLPSAMLVATSPILPAPGVRKQLVSYDVVTDPDTGLTFEYRYWGAPDNDEDREVVECNFGFAKGEDKGLSRITNP